MSRDPRRPYAVSCVAALVLVLATLGYRLSTESLQEIYFLSGWVAAAALLVMAMAWWSPGLGVTGLRRTIQRHLWQGAVLVALFSVHTEFRAPNGWLELAMTGLFAAMIVSTALGALMLRAQPRIAELALRSINGQILEPRVVLAGRWLLAHVALTFALLTLAIFHGVFVHTHGLLAHYLLGH